MVIGSAGTGSDPTAAIKAAHSAVCANDRAIAGIAPETVVAVPTLVDWTFQAAFT